MGCKDELILCWALTLSWTQLATCPSLMALPLRSSPKIQVQLLIRRLLTVQYAGRLSLFLISLLLYCRLDMYPYFSGSLLWNGREKLELYCWKIRLARAYSPLRKNYRSKSVPCFALQSNSPLFPTSCNPWLALPVVLRHFTTKHFICIDCQVKLFDPTNFIDYLMKN